MLEAKISTEDMKYPGAKIVLTGEMQIFVANFWERCIDFKRKS